MADLISARRKGSLLPEIELIATGQQAAAPLLRAGLLRGTRKAAGAIVRRAKINVSGRFLRLRTGKLRRSIRSRVFVGKSGDIVGLIGSRVFYGRILERGTGPYLIKPSRHDFLTIPVGGGRVLRVQEVHHPGHRARRWLRHSAEEVRAEVEAAFRAELERLLRGRSA
ncbi:MAG: HK97 gp10 family phage protein [Candidatus Rokubacteria bacterium]|nr:HK97 gp10 family phage protein [Candidatus Rokubacteria bacterium]